MGPFTDNDHDMYVISVDMFYQITHV